MRPEEEIGQRLRIRREELGLSLEDIVQETKIRSKYLKALEDGNFQIIPGEVYLKGFIKSYAKALDLDLGDLAAVLPHTSNATEQTTGQALPDGGGAEFSSRPDFSADMPSRRLKSGDHSSGNTMRSVMQLMKVIAIVLVVVLAFYYVYTNIILVNLPDPIDNGSSLEPGGNGDEEPGEPEPEPPKISIISDSTTSAVIEVQADTIELTISATARCWLRVQEDDNPPESQTLEPGDTVTFAAEREILMRAGNSAAITILIHDEQVDVSGSSGGVKNYSITVVP